jgi:hypothetical protein
MHRVAFPARPDRSLGFVRRSWRQASRISRCDRGGVLPMVAFALPVFIGFVGMALEMGSWFVIHQRMQNAADSAALAAGRAFVANNAADLTAQAKATAATYIFTTANGSTVTVNRAPLTGAYAGNTKAVEVIITQTQSRSFSSIFTNSPVTIRARAVSSANAAPVCLLALNASAAGAVNLSGGAIVNTPACDVKVNSSNAGALTGSGGAVLSSKNVYVTGAENLSGGATVNVTGVNQTGTASVPDPYAATAIPTASGCTQTNYATTTSATLNPGTYCGGISISSSAVVTFNPGVYIIDQGVFSVTGSATVNCSGCTIVLTSSTGINYPTVNIAGGTIVSISAPTTGPTAAFAFMGDRNMPTGTAMTFTGGSMQHVEGLIYIPKARITYSGNTSGTTNCSKVVADTFVFTGTSNFSGVCANYPNETAKSAVTLVE